MIVKSMIVKACRLFAAIGLALAITAAPGAAQDKPKIKVGSLTLPVFAPIVLNIIKAKGFDAKNGFELDVVTYPAFPAYYAGLATGEVDTLIGGPTFFQKLRLEGVPIKIVATGATLSDLLVLTADPAIKTLADLKGKQIAADMGSGQYQILAIYAASKGLDLKKDITIVNANFAVARAQLAAGRVEAAMVIEPIATLMLKENPKLTAVFEANKAWKELTGSEGWELVYAMREGFHQARARNAQDVPRRLAGCFGFPEIQSGRGRQDRLRNREAAARHAEGSGRLRPLGVRCQARLGRRAQGHLEHAGAGGAGGLPSQGSGRRLHLRAITPRA